MNSAPLAEAEKGLALYRWLSRFAFLNYRAKIMAMAFVGTHVPLLALAGWFALQSSRDWHVVAVTVGVTLCATLLGTGATLFVLNELLRPVLLTSKALRAYRETRERQPLPIGYGDEVGTLMADAGLTINHLEATLDALEHVDESTRLPNRKRFAELVEARIAQGQPFAVAALRLSNLSRIADTMDLRRAEEAARAVAGRFAERVEFGDQLARVGMAEFACIVATRRSDSEPWLEAAARLRAGLDACSDDVLLDGMAVRPILYGGLAVHPGDGADAQTLIDRSIAAAAQAVDATPVMMHSAEARQVARQRFRIEQELRRAIENDEFELHYQPVIDLRMGCAVGGEALIRWHHPENGLVMPGAFIEAAETSGLIEPIGLWVLRRACAQLREWNDRGRRRLRVSINLSARQFLDPALKRHVMEAIEQHGISADQLEIELTETAAMADHDHTRRVFTSLRDEGIGIAIDDFGTGYASLSSLRKLPFDKLKIDREFVAGVHGARQGQAICGALIELARGLDLEVLAEGTESEHEVRYLAERGCNLFQGYYFARPMQVAAFENLVDTASSFVLRPGDAPVRLVQPALA